MINKSDLQAGKLALYYCKQKEPSRKLDDSFNIFDAS